MMTIDQALQKGLCQLTRSLEPSENFTLKYKHIFTGVRSSRQLTNIEWLESEETRINSDVSRTAAIVLVENNKVALFVNCIIPFCADKTHQHV